MYGIIKAVEYNATINQSRIHFECTHVDPTMKNYILSFVYKVLPEKQKEIFEALSETEQDAKALGDSINLTDETINKQNDLINAQNINQDKDIDEIIKANSNAVNSSDFNLNNE